MNTKKIVFFIMTLFFMGSLFSCNKSDLSSNKAKYSYAIGYQFGNNIKREGVELDKSAFMAAMEDALKGKKSALTMDEVKKAMTEMYKNLHAGRKGDAEKSAKEGLAYLEKNKKKKEVHITPSGLQYEILKKGKGKRPKATDIVKVHYKGTLINGKEFDSSYKRNRPAEFPLNRVIPGWTEGLQLMNKGAKYRFTIPGDLAYGPRGTSGIPGNSVLIFEVELLDIKSKK